MKKHPGAALPDLRSPSMLQAGAARSLTLINVLEQVVSFLVSDRDILQAILRDLASIENSVLDTPDEVAIDPEGRTRALMSKISAVARRLYDAAVAGQNALCAGAEDGDGVDTAVTEYIAACADVFNASERIRDTLETLEARHSPVIGTYTDVKDLLAALKS